MTNPETTALLKLLEIGRKQVVQGKLKPMAEVFTKLKADIKPTK